MGIDQGYLKVFRKFFDSDLWEEKRVYSKAEAWLDLLRMARYKDEPKQMLDKRGSYVLNYGDIYISERFLSNRWKWSTSKVRKYLAYLEDRESICYSERSNQRSIINLVKLGVYAGWQSAEESAEEAQEKRGRSAEEAKKKKERNKESKKERKDIYADFPDLNVEAWEKWLAYKKQIKDDYKTENGERQKIQELINLTKGDKAYQERLIQKAINEEWRGIHLPRGQSSGRPAAKSRTEANLKSLDEFISRGQKEGGIA